MSSLDAKEKAPRGPEGHFRPSTSANTDYYKVEHKKAKLSTIFFLTVAHHYLGRNR